ncbi:reverse transcriptase domain-containing protein [Turneriella parva]|uniref:RNA-directed DNA polymerase n=1 Tax=Turneriella parva (strain ATCC BAA-1111 / DSM 21527 / NCTC 11395 / H) TaxID=869212 RepID=I4BA02_TURPD|nr:reverse transcriptase domain-containing protein [Turneriella parva]AFM14109.1 RNA-directed DNA polymerase [Turneriella parva DSM 21527]
MLLWTPHLFEKAGIQRKYDIPYIARLIDYGNQLSQRNLPVIFSLKHFSRLTDINYSYLRAVIDRTEYPYKTFKIRKKTEGFRRISVPDSRLLVIQQWLHKHILSKIQPHFSSTAFNPGCSIMRNAQPHCGANWLIKIDIENFFDSISERQVYTQFKALGYSKYLCFCFARLSTRLASREAKKYKKPRWQNKRHQYPEFIGNLPQGAPTSPILANLVCRQLDAQIHQLIQPMGLIYTRYADDIVISGNALTRKDASKLIQEISKILNRSGFQKNSLKTRILSPGARKIVTGLNVNGPNPTIPKKLKYSIRAELHYAKVFGVAEHCKKLGYHKIDGFRNQIRGKIDFVRSVNPKLADKFYAQLDDINWP